MSLRDVRFEPILLSEFALTIFDVVSLGLPLNASDYLGLFLSFGNSPNKATQHGFPARRYTAFSLRQAR